LFLSAKHLCVAAILWDALNPAMRRDDERGNLDNRRVALPRLRAQFDESPEMDFFLFLVLL
jgi:hypothetical protein